MNQSLYRLLPLFCILFLLSFSLDAQEDVPSMTTKRMGKILTKEVGKMEGQDGAWQFTYAGHPVLVITDDAPIACGFSLPSLKKRTWLLNTIKKCWKPIS